MSPSTGRREANKQATRAALRHAAARLFAEHGYEATTVAQIASTAQVGERTFYRYFDGKDDLLAEEILAWIDILNAEIRGRPASEGPYLAVARAMTASLARFPGGPGPGSLVHSDQAQLLSLLRRATPRPLRRLEQSIAGAVLQRLAASPSAAGQASAARSAASAGATGPPVPVPAPAAEPADGGADQPDGLAAAEFRAQLVAGVAVAALRAAAIRHRDLVRAGAPSPGIEPLLEYAFAQIRDLIQAAT